MPLDHPTLDLMRQSHPTWRLLRSDHVALVASFLQRVFVAQAFPKSALEYLNDWAAPDKGWLRKFYAPLPDT